MRRRVAALAMAILAFCGFAQAETGVSSVGNVVLLHGLARSAASMAPLARRLQAAGYTTCNVSYPSRAHAVETLAAEYVWPAIRGCFGDAPGPVHFVTHSMGGIIARQLAASGVPLSFGRVVMLAPPNGGSEVVDVLGDWSLFGALNGPAGRQLGTGDDALPQRLGPAPFELGVIAGNRSINLILSTMIDGEDDGKVAVARARLDGMADFIVVPVSHPLIMRSAAVAEEVIHFLAHGAFAHSTAGRSAVAPTAVSVQRP